MTIIQYPMRFNGPPKNMSNRCSASRRRIVAQLASLQGYIVNNTISIPWQNTWYRRGLNLQLYAHRIHKLPNYKSTVSSILALDRHCFLDYKIRNRKSSETRRDKKVSELHMEKLYMIHPFLTLSVAFRYYSFIMIPVLAEQIFQ